MRVSVLGMGKMGHAVAEVLLGAGHDVTVWNRSPGKADDLSSRGVADLSGKDAAEAACEAQAVMISLSDDAAVRSVVLDQGVADALGRGRSEAARSKAASSEAVLVDMSTVSPGTSRELSKAVNGRFLASPILGAPNAVASRSAAYLIGGSSFAYEQLQPVFGALSEKLQYVGDDPGRALELKLLANSLLLCGLATLSEVVATAQALGVDDATITAFLKSSPLVAPGLNNRLEDVVSGEHEGWFTTALGAKDIRLAEQLAAEARLRLPVTEAVKRRYEQAAAEGLADLDIGAIVELLRRG